MAGGRNLNPIPSHQHTQAPGVDEPKKVELLEQRPAWIVGSTSMAAV